MFTEAFDLVVGSDHMLAGRNALDLDVELIRNLRFLVRAGSDPAELDTSQLDTAGIVLGQAHEVDCDRDLETLVVAQFGIAILPSSALRSARVRHLSYPALDLQRTVAIYTVSGRARTREASALLMLVRAADWSQPPVSQSLTSQPL